MPLENEGKTVDDASGNGKRGSSQRILPAPLHSASSLFGAVLGEDFTPLSDIDVLVEFDPHHVPGLEFFAMETELIRLLGRKADLHTPQFLSPHLRKKVLQEAEVQCVAS